MKKKILLFFIFVLCIFSLTGCKKVYYSDKQVEEMVQATFGSKYSLMDKFTTSENDIDTYHYIYTDKAGVEFDVLSSTYQYAHDLPDFTYHPKISSDYTIHYLKSRLDYLKDPFVEFFSKYYNYVSLDGQNFKVTINGYTEIALASQIICELDKLVGFEYISNDYDLIRANYVSVELKEPSKDLGYYEYSNSNETRLEELDIYEAIKNKFIKEWSSSKDVFDIDPSWTSDYEHIISNIKDIRYTDEQIDYMVKKAFGNSFNLIAKSNDSPYTLSTSETDMMLQPGASPYIVLPDSIDVTYYTFSDGDFKFVIESRINDSRTTHKRELISNYFEQKIDGNINKFKKIVEKYGFKVSAYSNNIFIYTNNLIPKKTIAACIDELITCMNINCNKIYYHIKLDGTIEETAEISLSENADFYVEDPILDIVFIDSKTPEGIIKGKEISLPIPMKISDRPSHDEILKILNEI